MLTNDAKAFGGTNREAILELQRQGIAAGTTYAVPFPVLVDKDASCVVLDFHVYNSFNDEKPTRGTDIMYVDLSQDKVNQIDTLRHALRQPKWVFDHFTNTALIS